MCKGCSESRKGVPVFGRSDDDREHVPGGTVTRCHCVTVSLCQQRRGYLSLAAVTTTGSMVVQAVSGAQHGESRETAWSTVIRYR